MLEDLFWSQRIFPEKPQGPLGLLPGSKPREVCAGSVSRVKAVPVLVVLWQSSRNPGTTRLEPELRLLELPQTQALLQGLQSCFL